MKKIALIILITFIPYGLDVSASVYPLKRPDHVAASLMIDKLFPTKRPLQPILSQILSNKDYELFELALQKILRQIFTGKFILDNSILQLFFYCVPNHFCYIYIIEPL